MRISVFTGDIVMDIGVVFFFILFAFLLFVAFAIIASFFRPEKRYRFVPEVSIIVPFYNEEQNIERCIRSILDSDYPKEQMELILVDDKSGDRSADIALSIIEEQKKKGRPNIRLVRQPHSGKSAALNLGIKNAIHGIVITVDADTVLEKGCIRELTGPMEEKGVGATNGVVMIYRPRNLLERFQDAEFCYNNLIRLAFSKMFNSGIWFMGAVACYRKGVFQDYSFRKEDMAEDMDISLAISQKGMRVVTVGRAVYSTAGCPTLGSLFNQRMRWWFGVLIALVKNRRVLSKKRANPSIWFLYINQFWWTFYSIFSLPIFIYQINYWLPKGPFIEVFMYFFRWFSLLGPVYVLYKIPEWGITLANIFGVTSGIISAGLIFASYHKFRRRLSLWELCVVFFYFPYTIIVNLIIVFSLGKYLLKKRRAFID